MTNFKIATMEALEFLRTHNNVGMIATVDGEGQPFLSPVHYFLWEGFNIFFITTNTTHKSKNIENNNKVAFTVGDGPEYISVMIRGKANVANNEEEEKVVSFINTKLDGKLSNWPINKLEDLREQNLVVYKIAAEKVTFLNINSKEEPQSTSNHLYHLMD